MQLTITDFQKLTTESGHDTPIVIKDNEGNRYTIDRIAFEQVHEIVPKIVPADLDTGHETIVPNEQTSTRLVIEIS